MPYKNRRKKEIMFKEFKYYEKMWGNHKKRKNFEMEFKNWSQEDKRHFLESGFQIQLGDWIKIKKIKVYLYSKDTIRIGVYTGRHIIKFMLFMANENAFHPMNYNDGYHMDYEVLLKRTPII